MINNKTCQGMDGINFKAKLNIQETYCTPYEERLNQRGEKVFAIKIVNNILSVYCNLPRVIRDDNVIPFGISDYNNINFIKDFIICNVRDYLNRYLIIVNQDELIQALNVSSAECNLTSKCINECTPSDVMKLINISRCDFKKDTLSYQKPKQGSKYEKDYTYFGHEKANNYKLKIYDKSLETNRNLNFDIEKNVLRIEIVYMRRLLSKMFSNNLNINNVFTEDGFNKLLNQYTVIFEDDIIKNIKEYLNEISKNIFEFLISSKENNFLQSLLIKYKQNILDVEILRKVLKKYSKWLHKGFDYSRQTLYRVNNKYDLPHDVIKTIKKFHDLCKG